MRIERTIPRPPPPEYQMTFSRNDGYALIMCLRDAYKKYPKAVNRGNWNEWADNLEKTMGTA